MNSQVDRGFTRIADGQVHYMMAGTRTSRPPLICLHASPASSKSLLPLIREFSRSHFVIAPDTLGNGQSDAPESIQPDLAYYAGAMDRFCEALGLETIDVYGQHTGAHIAAEWAILNPTRVRRVALDQLAVLSETEQADFLQHYAPVKMPDETGSQFHWAWNFIRDQMIFFPYYKKDAEHLRAGGTFNPETLHELTLDVLNSLKTYHMAYGAVFRHQLADRLPLLTQPALWISPDPNPENPVSEFVMKHLKQGQERYADAKNRPKALADLIDTFCC